MSGLPVFFAFLNRFLFILEVFNQKQLSYLTSTMKNIQLYTLTKNISQWQSRVWKLKEIHLDSEKNQKKHILSQSVGVSSEASQTLSYHWNVNYSHVKTNHEYKYKVLVHVLSTSTESFPFWTKSNYHNLHHSSWPYGQKYFTLVQSKNCLDIQWKFLSCNWREDYRHINIYNEYYRKVQLKYSVFFLLEQRKNFVQSSYPILHHNPTPNVKKVNAKQ